LLNLALQLHSGKATRFRRPPARLLFGDRTRGLLQALKFALREPLGALLFNRNPFRFKLP